MQQFHSVIFGKQRISGHKRYHYKIVTDYHQGQFFAYLQAPKQIISCAGPTRHQAIQNLITQRLQIEAPLNV